MVRRPGGEGAPGGAQMSERNATETKCVSEQEIAARRSGLMSIAVH
jgi:hypothetical protein